MLPRRAIFLFAVLILPALAADAPAPNPASCFRSKIQSWKIQEEEAFCGAYPVWENRAAKSGRKIGLKIVVVPAQTPHPNPDPIFFLAGGPGQAATTIAAGMAGNPVRRNRDFVYVDQRGTGEPNRLGCELGGREDDLQSYLGEMFPVAAVERCRDELAKRADLTLYT